MCVTNRENGHRTDKIVPIYKNIVPIYKDTVPIYKNTVPIYKFWQ